MYDVDIKDAIIRITVSDYLENGIYPRFWDHIFNPPLLCTPVLLKPHSRGQLPSSNFEIGKMNTPTNLPSFSKYCVNVHPLYKILECISKHRIENPYQGCM